MPCRLPSRFPVAMYTREGVTVESIATSNPVEAASLITGEVTLAPVSLEVRNVQSVATMSTEAGACGSTARSWIKVTPMWPTIGYQSPPSLPDRQMPERPATSTAGSAHGCVASIASAIWAGVELFPPSMKPGRSEPAQASGIGGLVETLAVAAGVEHAGRGRIERQRA